MATPGYEVPLHRSLTEEILLGGAPRMLAIINGTLLAALGLMMHSWLAVPACVALHVSAVALTKRDPQFMDCMRRQIRQPTYYSH